MRHLSVLPRLAIAALPLFVAVAARAHDGHGATPAHVHVGNDLPVDVGGIVIVALLLIGAALPLVRAFRRNR
jgi:hypothetical protein